MFRGERGVGTWTVVVRDEAMNAHEGTFTDWHLKLWGESIDETKATLLPMPNENDDDDHDKPQTTIVGPAKTTTLPANPDATKPHTDANPTDHPHRPTKQPGSGTKPEEETSGSVDKEPTKTPSSSWVSWLPSFGASKKAQVWIYGAAGLIVAFCSGLGIYFWIARRRQRRNDSRNNYEFELIDEEEGEGLNRGEKGVAGNGRRTRGGELYDAFAGGSDDEDDDDDEFDEYRDRSARQLDGHYSDGEEEQHVIGEESDDEQVNEKGENKPLSGQRS